jgi:hypothetical protein
VLQFGSLYDSVGEVQRRNVGGGTEGRNPLDEMNMNVVRNAIGARYFGTLRLAQLLHLIK